jgi:hypothetical protein
MLARASGDSFYFSGVFPALLVCGLGLASTVAPLTATAMSALPSEHAGLASAVNNDVSRLGGLVAVAVLPALAGMVGRTYLDPAAMGNAFRTAVFIAGAWCGIGAVAAVTGIRNGARSPAGLDEWTHCALDAAPLAVRRPA